MRFDGHLTSDGGTWTMSHTSRMYLVLFTVALQSLTDVGQSPRRQREHRPLLAVPPSTVSSVLDRCFSPCHRLLRPVPSSSGRVHPMEPPRSVSALTVLYGGVTAAETVTEATHHILGEAPFHPENALTSVLSDPPVFLHTVVNPHIV